MKQATQHILITGTSSGLGHGLAHYYLQQGHHVYGISRKKADDLSLFHQFHYYPCDLTDEKQVAETIQQLSEQQQLNLVVLNAGYLNQIKDMKETSLEEIRNSMEINTWANKTLIDQLSSKISHVEQIIAISSGASISGNRGWNAYSLSKAALNMLIKLYAEELPNIHFTALAPGLVDTAMQDYISGINDERFKVVDRLQSCKGTELMPSPEQLAPKLARAIELVKQQASGEFIDIRKLDL